MRLGNRQVRLSLQPVPSEARETQQLGASNGSILSGFSARSS